jgi:hypothetical protein
MAHKLVYKELGENVSIDNKIEFVCSYGSKFYLHTDLELKGRGISLSGNGSNHKRGLKSYYATEKAMNKLKVEYKCTYMANL